MKHVLRRIFIVAPKILHQLLDRRVTGHQQLDVLRGIVVVKGICDLPRLFFGGEDVNFGVFAGECIVVSYRRLVLCLVENVRIGSLPGGSPTPPV
jgi:hypothetical protein